MLANVTVYVILAVSAVAKFRAPQETRDAFVALRLPEWLRRSPAPALLPWAELVLAVALFIGIGWLLIVASVLSVALFAAYAVIIGRALNFDEPVRCACFGKLGSGDVSNRTFARNVLLFLTAVLGLVGAWFGVSLYTLSGVELGWVALALLTAAVATITLGGYGSDSSGPVVEASSPNVRHLVLTDVAEKKRVRLGDLATRGNGVVLVFLMSGCGACEQLVEDLPRLRSDNPERLIVPVRPSDQASDPKWEGLTDLHEDWSSNIAKLLVGELMPTALELDARGTVVAKASGAKEIGELISGIAAGSAEPEPAVAVEPQAETQPSVEPAPVPEPPLPPDPSAPEEDDGLEEYEREEIPDAVVIRSDHQPFTLKELAGQQAQLLVAVNCRCAPARQAMTSVEDWARRLPVVETRLMPSIKLTEGEVAEVVAESAVYDHRGFAAKALGATGQVAAVLLGADGLLAGGPVTGLDEVEGFVADIEAQIGPAG